MIFRQVFRIAFVTLIWKQYKHVIVSTLLLFVFLFLVSSLHADFLKHAQIQNEVSHTGASFIYKWLAFCAGVMLYFFYHYLRRNTKNTDKTKQEKIGEELSNLDDDQDPFAAIRARKTLRSRADFITKDKD